MEIEKAVEIIELYLAGAPLSNINAFDKDRFRNSVEILLKDYKELKPKADKYDKVIEKLESDVEHNNKVINKYYNNIELVKEFRTLNEYIKEILEME